MKTRKDVENELKKFWKIKSLRFLAKFHMSNLGKTSFRNIRTLDGRIIKYPNGIDISIPIKDTFYQEGIDYEINTFVAPDDARKRLEFDYLLYLDTIKEPPKQMALSPIEHIAKISAEYESPVGIAREAMVGMVNRLAIETSKKPETFIFELIQNADDYPNDGGDVHILFKTLDNYLLVCHTGQPFYPNNVHALCSVNAGDKSENRNTTGFKGIGFKSIFKHSNYVWVCSGGYSFRFDEMYHRKRGNETFWQLIPVWTKLEEVDSELNSADLSSFNVTFAIKPKEGALKINDYEKSLISVFSDERVLIFLRSIKSLTFEGHTCSFIKERSNENWVKSHLSSISVPDDLVQQINRIIDKEIDARIPPKYKDMFLSKITFATEIKNGAIQKTQNAKVYSYLPTELNFGFSFLLNGDFIPDGDRTRLFWDIKWNEFLFERAGYEFIQWLAELWDSTKDKNLLALFPDFSNLLKVNQNDEDKARYLELFKNGVIEGIKSVRFIPDLRGKLHLASELLFDRTGIVEELDVIEFQNISNIDLLVAHDFFSSYHPLTKLLEELPENNFFTKEDLLNLVDTDKMQFYLGDFIHNITFLKYLDKKKWLTDFADKNIFLDQDFGLSSGSKIYYDLKGDEDLLKFLVIKLLHPDVKSSLIDIELPLNRYAPLGLLESYIIPKTSEINTLIRVKENCIKFYQYLYKHYEKLPDNPYFTNQLLSGFGIIDIEEIFIPNIKGKNIYLADQQLINLSKSKALPEGLFHLISPSIYEIEGNTGEKFWTKIGVLSFREQDVITFIEKTIINCKERIFTYYKQSKLDIIGEQESVILRNKELWSFIIMVWNKIPEAKQNEWRQHIEKLPIYTINKTFQPMSLCYINDEGNLSILGELMGNDLSIEIISPRFNDSEEDSTINWDIIFSKFGAKKIDEKDIIDELIKYALKGKPSSLDVHNKIILKLFGFHIQEKLTNEHYGKLKNLYVRIKSRNESEYEHADKCHFATEYKPKIDLEVLGREYEIKIAFIHSFYAEISDDLDKIKNFFIKIGVSQGFGITVQKNEISRLDVPVDYISYIDLKSPKIANNAVGWSYQHKISNWVKMKYIDLLIYPKIAIAFWKYVIEKPSTLEVLFSKVTYNCYFPSEYFDNYVIWKIQQYKCFPAKDNILYQPTNLYSSKIGALLNEDSKNPYYDLSSIIVHEKSIEELLGMQTEYNISLCLKAFHVIQDLKVLRKHRIWQKLVRLCENENSISINEKQLLKNYVNNGFLINQIGEWVKVDSLKILDDDIDLGFGYHPGLLYRVKDKEYDLTKVGILMGVEILKMEDFNPIYISPTDDGFKEILLNKLNFIAIAENNEMWEEMVQNFDSKLSLYTFLRTSKIIYQCAKTNPPIEQTEKVIDMVGNTLYYVDKWNGPHSYPLFEFIYKVLELKNISIKAFIDIIQYSTEEIFSYFDEKNIKYPPEWKPKSQVEVQSNTNISTINEPEIEYNKIEISKGDNSSDDDGKRTQKNWIDDLNEQDILALEKLMGGSLSNDDKKNQVILALFRALNHYEQKGYDVSYARANIQECIKKHMLVGVYDNNTGMQLKILARSAKSGILKLNYNAWFDLMDANCELFVVIGNAADEYRVFKTQESLATDDPWVLKLDGGNKYTEIQSLIKGDYANASKKFAQFQFLIRLIDKKEFQSIFESIPEVDGNFDPDSLD
jgi:hypothetical protein